jgi:CubicO group peptidase (beta-lactamase class C family)
MRSIHLVLAAALAACAPAPPPAASTPAPLPPATAAAAATPPQRFEAGALPPPRFVDPERRAKITAQLPQIEQIFRDWMKEAKVPGVAVAIVVDGETISAKGFGARDLASNAPAAPDTMFRIASMTKSFTALSILKLRDEGKIGLDDPAARYVPELAALSYPTRDAPAITLRHLLSHGAGFPEDNPWGDRQLAISDDAFSALLARGIPFSHAPATGYEYSNLGFMLLGRVVARVSGGGYEEYVEKQLLRPLGMTSTTFDARAVPKERFAIGYRRDGDTFQPEPALAPGAGSAMGGLFSTAEDLARYAAFHLAAWPPRDDPETGPIRRSSVRELDSIARLDGVYVSPATATKPLRALAAGYGFGMGVWASCATPHGLSHSGGLPGYGSVLMMLPEQGLAITVLTNVTYAFAGFPARRTLELLDRAGALSPRKAQPAPALLAARAAVAEAIARRDADLLGRVVADNFFLDKPRDAWRERLAKLAPHGACRADEALDASNALRGHFRLTCDKGFVDAFITLAPTSPPMVQLLELEEGFDPEPRLVRAAEDLLATNAEATSRDASRRARTRRASAATASTSPPAAAPASSAAPSTATPRPRRRSGSPARAASSGCASKSTARAASRRTSASSRPRAAPATVGRRGEAVARQGPPW